MNGNWQWSLGTGRSTMSAVYGARIPLSRKEKDVEVKECPCCGEDLVPPKHGPVHPGKATFLLAKGWANALLGAWKRMDRKDKGVVRRPSMACAAWASYEAPGHSGNYFCLAGTSDEVAPETWLGSLRATTVEEFCNYTNPPVWPEVDAEAKIVFANGVLASDSEGAKQAALDLLGRSCWEAMEDRRQWAVGNSEPPRNTEDDPDELYELLACTEQRVLLAHRLVMKNPEIVCLSGSGFTFTLKQMTVALADEQSDDQSPYASWYGKNHGRGHDTPAPPCNTCRAVLPALLCGLTVEPPP